jgi:4-carboxymuconolactone decarboxylase
MRSTNKHADGGPRMSPVIPPYAPDTEKLLTKWMPPGTDLEPLRLFRLLALHHDMFDRLRPMASGLLNHGLLPARDRELVISRTTARAGAEYEWGVHAVMFGDVVGLSRDQLDALATEPADSAAFDERTRKLVTAVDELYDEATLDAETWRGLQQLYSDAQLLEFVILTGWYRTLSTVITSVELSPEPWAERFPANRSPS